MSVRAEILNGRVKQIVKSESGNLAFMLEDNSGNVHYCFSAGKKPLLNSSDQLVLIGSYLSASKFRVSFILNKTKNTEVNLVETKSDWIYNGTLILAILVTCVFVFYFIFSFFLSPPVDPYGYSYPFTIITRIFLILLLGPTMIILWILVAFFSKSRKKGSDSEREILKLKKEYQEYYSKAPSTTTTSSIAKPNFCPNCGGKLPVEAKFCPSCGSEF